MSAIGGLLPIALRGRYREEGLPWAILLLTAQHK